MFYNNFLGNKVNCKLVIDNTQSRCICICDLSAHCRVKQKNNFPIVI